MKSLKIFECLRLNKLCRCTTRGSRLKGPMARGEKIIELDDEYLSRFDEIVVIGDIHGCGEEFEELLKQVHSESPSKNPDKTLKIIVGDLVNKGPLNEKVLKLCVDKYQKSILAVRGNHDELVLSQHKKYKRGEQLEERNRWIQSLPSRYISYLHALPYVISIPTLGCIVVHAGLDPSREDPIRETPERTMTTMRNIQVAIDAKTGDTSYLCTKVKDKGAPWATFWPGPQHVYFGHDARRRLQNDHEFATGLDTGCVYGDRLSYIYVKGSRKGQINSIQAKKVYEATSDDEKS